MKTTQRFGSIDLYPEKSFNADIRAPVFDTIIHGISIPVRGYFCTALNQKPHKDRERKVPWSAREKAISQFIRLDFDTGFFFDAWARTAINMPEEPIWRRLNRLNTVQTLLGDDFVDRWIMNSRPFDPTDYRKKRSQNFEDGRRSVPNTATSLSLETLQPLASEPLWHELIPRAIRHALLIEPNANAEFDENLLEEAGDFGIALWSKDTKFRSKQDAFRDRYRTIDTDTELRSRFIHIAREALRTAHSDLRTAVVQAATQALTEASKARPDLSFGSARRYFDFWYGQDSHISKALDGLVPALTPVRSLIHRQPFAIHSAFEKETFCLGQVPCDEVCRAIYASALTYPEWLELSRAYARS